MSKYKKTQINFFVFLIFTIFIHIFFAEVMRDASSIKYKSKKSDRVLLLETQFIDRH
jgi:hypothetical protein